MEACIFNIQRYSLHDGGGIRTIVFFKGCPFTCPWCCNPESLSPKPQLFFKKVLCINCSRNKEGICMTPSEECPTGAKETSGKMMSIDEVYDIIERDRPFYDASQGGVTLSGGEFLMQSEFAVSLLEKCQENKIHTAVETTLALPIPHLERLVHAVDLFLVDFKLFDEEQAKQILHMDLKRMKANVEAILHLGGRIIPRIPLIPEYTATDENLNQIIHYLKQHHLKEVHLLPFHQLGEAKYASIEKTYTMHEVKPLSDEQIQTIEQKFIQEGFRTVIHGN